ncbi:MAG: FAD-binding oxidoreductase [Pseudomonadota bacterium]
MASAGLVAALPFSLHASESLVIENVTRLYSVRVSRVVAPTSIDELVRAMKVWPEKIAVGGGRYSMGGQIAIQGGLHIDMRRMKRLVWLNPASMLVRVQAGMRWRDLQDVLDPLDLSVQTMQSYANFTVGGSVSVNAHGRYVGHGPIARSVRALQLVLADGKIVEASRETNPDLFGAVLGGYGALGVIAEVELWVDRNVRIERSVAQVRLKDYPSYFERKIKADAKCLMHNADLLPPLFDVATAVNWMVTEKALTAADRLVPRDQTYALEQSVIWALTELPKGPEMQRKVVRPALLGKSAVVWRNYEASLDAASLEPKSRTSSTYVLQEYFVPLRHFASFAGDMADIFRSHDTRVLNVSIRHSPTDQDAVMAWAREEVFSFVIYHKQGVGKADLESVGVWTRLLIAAALRYEGTYYLPYQRHATREQFDAAYPNKGIFKSIKAKFDPVGKMSNELWAQYL